MKCTVGKTIINYDEIGTGKLILFFSGIENDMSAMKSCFEPLFSKRTGWKRVYVDHPGVGDTIVGNDIKTPKDILEVLMKFVDKTVGKERFVIAGYSFGGYVARYIAKNKFDFVDGIMLLAPLIIPHMEKCNVDRNVKKIKNVDTNLQSMIDERINLELYGAMAKTNKDFFQLMYKKAHELDLDVDDFKEPFEKPALIVTGRQDTTVGYKDAFKILNNFPRATYCTLDKAGHEVQIEQEKIFNILVKEWIYRLEEKR